MFFYFHCAILIALDLYLTSKTIPNSHSLRVTLRLYIFFYPYHHWTTSFYASILALSLQLSISLRLVFGLSCAITKKICVNLLLRKHCKDKNLTFRAAKRGVKNSNHLKFDFNDIFLKFFEKNKIVSNLFIKLVTMKHLK